MAEKAKNYESNKNETIKVLCEAFKKHNYIDPGLFSTLNVKRGLRNADGSGVLAGLTLICNVHGYVMCDGEKIPEEGQLIYRGYDIKDIVSDCVESRRFGFEEIIYLLLFGALPNEKELSYFKDVLALYRDLPDGFLEDIILNRPSKNIMNKMQSAILAMYTYDDKADSIAIEQELRKSIEIIARMSTVMIYAYRSFCKAFNKEGLIVHSLNREETIAQSILSTLRFDRQYSIDEALLLDVLLMLHAEHGGGNNSTFTCRCLTSTGTDSYSAYSAAVGSLKGPKHGGANQKVMEMLDDIEKNVSNLNDLDELKAYLEKIVDKKAGDGLGLIYGMGHAVYTKSDPRAEILKSCAKKLAKGTEFEPKFKLIENIEAISKIVLKEKKGDSNVVCANVDLYSGSVYEMLKIPCELYTPLFATARIAGWAAHRIEEILTGKRIIRPAYKPVAKRLEYVPMRKRNET